ncbi:hypothetical protein AB1K54_13070 [Microbacterium sp. BWT-B31]|uniref:WXG100 family type VII secretion target n=1 Tax=Microbacterium sp. BWT-B31 TaxID=3232072 RepID=UPI0035278E57
MGLYGADIAQLRGTAAEFERAASALESIGSLLGGELSRAPWKGADATQFRSHWDTDYSRRIADASTRLREAAKSLRANADDQEATSMSDGGPGGAGGSGGAHQGGAGSNGGPGGSYGPGEIPKITQGYGTADNRPWHGTGWGGEGEVGEDGATWRLGGYAKGETEGDFFGADGKAEGEVGAGVKAHAGGSYSFGTEDDVKRGPIHENGLIGDGKGDPKHWGADITKNKTGLEASGEASAIAGAWAEGSAGFDAGYGSAGVSGEAMAGARADIGGGASIGENGLQLGASAGAFAGAEAKAGVEAEVLGVGGDLEVGVRAGIGIDAGANAQFSFDNVELEFELGAALGVGFTIKPSISFSPSEMAHDIMNLFG